MEPTDFATPLLRAQQLVPDYAQQDLQQRMGRLQLEGQGLQNQQAQAQLDAQKAQQQQQQAFQSDFTNAMLDPSAKSFSTLLGRHPQFQKQTKDAWDMLSSEKQTGDLRDMSSIYAAGQNGKYDLAAGIIKRRIDAEKAAGHEIDPTDQAIYDAFTSGDPTQQKAALGIVGTHVSAIVGPEKFATTLDSLGKSGGGTHVITAGGALVDDSGKELYKAPDKPEYRSVGAGETLYQVNDTGGGGQASGTGGGAPNSTSGSPRYSGEQIEQTALGAIPGLKVTSRARSPEHNREVGGVPNSLHLSDQARDFVPPEGMSMPALAGRLAKALPGSRIINEGDHVHVQSPAPAGGQAPQAGGARVVAQGQPKAGYRLMTPQENAAQGLDPNVRYQIGPEGQMTALGGQDKSQGQLKPTPQAPAKAILENTSTLREIDRAIKLVESRKESFGFTTGALGDRFTQWNDPKGAGPRAAVGKIGGKIIHDVSGAAVTLSESPRFQPYVPANSDDPDIILEKLRQMRALAAADAADLETAWGPDNGYRGIALPGKPVAGRPAAAKPAAQPAAPGGFKILSVRPK